MNILRTFWTWTLYGGWDFGPKCFRLTALSAPRVPRSSAVSTPRFSPPNKSVIVYEVDNILICFWHTGTLWTGCFTVNLWTSKSVNATTVENWGEIFGPSEQRGGEDAEVSFWCRQMMWWLWRPLKGTAWRKRRRLECLVQMVQKYVWVSGMNTNKLWKNMHASSLSGDPSALTLLTMS